MHKRACTCSYNCRVPLPKPDRIHMVLWRRHWNNILLWQTLLTMDTNTHIHTYTVQKDNDGLMLESTLLKPLNTLWSLCKQKQLLANSFSSPFTRSKTDRQTHKVEKEERTCCNKASYQRKQSIKYSVKVLNLHCQQYLVQAFLSLNPPCYSCQKK